MSVRIPYCITPFSKLNSMSNAWSECSCLVSSVSSLGRSEALIECLVSCLINMLHGIATSNVQFYDYQYAHQLGQNAWSIKILISNANYQTSIWMPVWMLCQMSVEIAVQMLDGILSSMFSSMLFSMLVIMLVQFLCLFLHWFLPTSNINSKLQPIRMSFFQGETSVKIPTKALISLTAVALYCSQHAAVWFAKRRQIPKREGLWWGTWSHM